MYDHEYIKYHKREDYIWLYEALEKTKAVLSTDYKSWLSIRILNDSDSLRLALAAIRNRIFVYGKQHGEKFQTSYEDGILYVRTLKK